jgi:hypothetical protein
MEQLEQYIINSNKIIYLDDIDYNIYNYESYDDLEIDLYFLIETLYTNCKIYKNKQERTEQEKFRRDLLNMYGKCIITGSNCFVELEAAHIVNFREGNHNTDINTIDNGLLLKSNIHKTFDEYLWTINPNTLMVEIKDNINAGEIMNYNGTKINNFLHINNNIIANLKKRYIDFNKN